MWYHGVLQVVSWGVTGGILGCYRWYLGVLQVVSWGVVDVVTWGVTGVVSGVLQVWCYWPEVFFPEDEWHPVTGVLGLPPWKPF